MHPMSALLECPHFVVVTITRQKIYVLFMKLVMNDLPSKYLANEFDAC